MNAVSRLKRDHEILRSKLNVLEAALKMGTEAWFVLREVSYTLARQLRDHIRREEDLVTACRQTLSPDILARLEVEHHDEPEHLRTINRLFIGEEGRHLSRIKPVLRRLIRGLRRHMEEEEMSLFPIFERGLAEQETRTPSATMEDAPLNEVMTVNRILREFPGTKPVFEHLFINIPFEGCDCLDEVAWRHGMDTRQLLAQLREAITESPAVLSGRNRLQETVQPRS